MASEWCDREEIQHLISDVEQGNRKRYFICSWVHSKYIQNLQKDPNVPLPRFNHPFPVEKITIKNQLSNRTDWEILESKDKAPRVTN